MWKFRSRKGRYLRLLDFYSAWLAGDITGGLSYRILGDLYVIDYTGSARGFGHASCGAFVLHHAGGSSPSGDPVLHVNLKAFFSDLRFGQLGFDGRLDLGVAELSLAVRHSEGSSRGRERRRQ